MSNIIRLAPYAYLARRSEESTLYDLLLLVPVDNAGDTNLNNVTPVKAGGTRITINYSTSGSPANALYRFKHFVIDSEDKYEDIEIKGNNSADLTTVVEFSEADDQEASVTNEYQTCAPYLFVKKETVSSTEKFAHPSCIVIFDPGLGALTEALVFRPDDCALNFTLGNSGVVTDPTKFAINQSIKAEITYNGVHELEVFIDGNSYFAKPPRRHKLKMHW